MHGRGAMDVVIAIYRPTHSLPKTEVHGLVRMLNPVRGLEDMQLVGLADNPR
jgi:hypothetical protein